MTRGRARARWLSIAGLVLLAVVAAVLFQSRVKHSSRDLNDFEVYYTAGTRALAGESLYRVEDGHWLFKYFPAFALAMAPLAALPPTAAKGVWFFASVGLLVVLLNRSLVLLPGRRRRAGFLVGLTVLALGKFYVREIGLGQSNLLLAVVVLFAVAAFKRGRDGTAGTLLAVATVVKPYAVLFLPYLAARRRTRAGLFFLGTLLVALLIPALRWGFQGNIALLAGWWDTVTTSTAPNLTVNDNISFAGMYAKWIGVGAAASWLAWISAMALVGACGVALLRKSKTPLPEYLDAAVVMMLMPLLSPQGWDYVLLVSTPAVMLLIDRLDEFPVAARVLLGVCLAVAGLTIWDLVGRELYRIFMLSSIVTLCALIELGMVLTLRVRRVD